MPRTVAGSQRLKDEDPFSSNCSRPPHAIGKIGHHAVLSHDFHQTMDIGFKARAHQVELSGKKQIIHDLFVEHLSRYQQRYAWRIRRHQRSRDSANQLIDGDPLSVPSCNLGKCVRGLHGGGEVTQVHFCGQASNVVLGVQLMDELTQVLQAHALVFGVLGAELGHDAPQGMVFIVIVFELLQGR